MSSRCQVDFYVLQSATQAAPHLACRLALMAWEKGGHIRVAVTSFEELQALDALMWELPSGRFLPHRLAIPNAGAAKGRKAPVILGTPDQFAHLEPDGAVMINLTAGAVTEPDRFQRILEIVPFSQQDRAHSRDKFRYYRDMGLDPASHDIKVATTVSND